MKSRIRTLHLAVTLFALLMMAVAGGVMVQAWAPEFSDLWWRWLMRIAL